MMEINLLAPHHRRRPVVQMLLLTLLLALAMLLLVGAFLQIYQGRLIRSSRQLAESQVNTETARREKAFPDPKAQELISTYSDLAAGQVQVTALLETLSKALPAQGKLRQITYEAPGALTVKGTLPDLQAVAGYITLLQQTGRFTAVTNPTALNAGGQVDFTLVLQMETQGVSK